MRGAGHYPLPRTKQADERSGRENGSSWAFEHVLGTSPDALRSVQHALLRITAHTLPPQLLNVQVPFFFKNIVDGLGAAASQPLDLSNPQTVWVVAGASILGCESSSYVRLPPFMR